MQVTVLGSGSRGNALVIESGGHRVLVDAGFSARALATRLAAARIAPESIDALLLTHEHDDHASGAVAASARWGWPVVATAGTLAALPALPRAATTVLGAAGAAVGPLRLDGVPVPHDAREPVAVLCTDTGSGARCGIVTDAGRVPEGLADRLGRLDILVVEANHDAARLAAGPYPAMLKRRIAGGAGHLNNAQAARLAGACVRAGLGAVVLAHLSETNNTPQLAVQAVRTALRAAGWRPRGLHVAAQGEVLHAVRLVGRTDPQQLALGV